MHFAIDDDRKIVSIWLTAKEHGEESALRPVLAVFRRRRYAVGIFYSGEGDAVNGICDLIRHNRELPMRPGRFHLKKGRGTNDRNNQKEK